MSSHEDATDLPNHFDGEVARRYDASSAPMFAPEVVGPTVDVLADLAGGRPALELAVGTGRVALPLRERGVDVAGIELSRATVEELRAKPGGEHVEVALGDMATTRLEHRLGTFGVAYLVFNTIGNLTTQDAQVAAFANAAAHLAPGGAFVVEVGVPSLQKLPFGERFVVFEHSEAHVGVDELDVVTQAMWSHHVSFDGPSGEQVHRASVPFRYVWPAELDLMARLAGMRLEHRWAGWDGAAFTATSPSHVSVWRTAAA